MLNLLTLTSSSMGSLTFRCLSKKYKLTKFSKRCKIRKTEDSQKRRRRRPNKRSLKRARNLRIHSESQYSQIHLQSQDILSIDQDQPRWMLFRIGLKSLLKLKSKKMKQSANLIFLFQEDTSLTLIS